MENAKKDSLEILLEDLQTDIGKVLDATDAHTKELKRLEPMHETLEQLKTDMDVVKTTLEQVSLVDMKQDISDLKKRVDELESRVVK